MRKNKIKLSLIDDYVKIKTAKIFFENSFEKHKLTKGCFELMEITNALDQKLEQLYLSLFQILKMNDVSFILLNKELDQNNSLFLQSKKCEFRNINSIIQNIHSQLNDILYNLKTKLNFLKITSTIFSIN